MFTHLHCAVYVYIGVCYALAATGVLPWLYEALIPAYLTLGLDRS